MIQNFFHPLMHEPLKSLTQLLSCCDILAMAWAGGWGGAENTTQTSKHQISLGGTIGRVP